MLKKKNKLLAYNMKIILIITAILCGSLVISVLSEQVKIVQEEPDVIEPDGTSSIHALVINEIMSSNKGALADSFGDTYDWVELYNGTTHNIDLTNFGLSDTSDETKWIFPSTIIKAKSFLVVYLTNTDLPGLYANFGLKSEGGEKIVLRDSGGMIVDQIQLPPLSANNVLARNNNGSWVVLDQVSPGFTNTVTGHQAYLDSISITQDKLIITEVLPKNAGNFTNTAAVLPGYIEITNTGLTPINLKNYALGDELASPFQWRFPSLTLDPGKSVLVYTSNLNLKEGELHADFTLNPQNGSVFLCDGTGHIIDRIDYSMVPNGYALQRSGDLIEFTPALSPGQSNTLEGITSFQNTLKTPAGLIINEVMTINTTLMLHNGANAYSWIELKNNSNSAIDLSEYTISESFNVLSSVALPKLILQPDEFIVVMASGDSSLSTSEYHHIDLKIKGDQSLYLFHGNQLQDCLFAAQVPKDTSYGRALGKGYVYMDVASPNAENKDGLRAVSLSVKSTVESGVYTVSTLNLDLLSSGMVYYTTNGETPTISSKHYTQPIQVTKTSVIKTGNIEEGKVPSEVLSYTYILNENLSLPVVSLTIDPYQFNELQSHPWDTKLEYGGHIEYYPIEGEGFSINCGVQLFGGSTRGLAKKSFSITFEEQYGEDKLNYPVFENRDFSVFDTLVLRSGSQDYSTTFFRDILASSIMEDSTTVEVQAFVTTTLYINGQYWGLYNIREKVDDDFVATHYNVDESTASVVRMGGTVSAGDKQTYNTLMSYLASHDLKSAENYDYVKTLLNIDSYIDFWVAELFTTNNDVINYRFISSTAYDDGRLNMIYYDLDYAWYYPNRAYYEFMINPDGMSDLHVSSLINRRLFENEAYRTRFLERLSLGLKTLWKEETVLAKLEVIYQSIRPEITRDFLRWKLDPNVWEGNVDFLRDFIQKRTGNLLRQTKDFFNLSDADYNYYFGDL
jgi:hypothetical protein